MQIATDRQLTVDIISPDIDGFKANGANSRADIDAGEFNTANTVPHATVARANGDDVASKNWSALLLQQVPRQAVFDPLSRPTAGAL